MSFHARYIVKAVLRKVQHRSMVLFQEETEEPEVTAMWAAEMYPGAKVLVCDRETGEILVWGEPLDKENGNG